MSNIDHLRRGIMCTLYLAKLVRNIGIIDMDEYHSTIIAMRKVYVNANCPDEEWEVWGLDWDW